jgi:uncharacterized protein
MMTDRRIEVAGCVCLITLAFGLAPLAQARDARLAEAAMTREIATVRALLQQGAAVDGALGDGMTALHWAAERGDAALADLLLAAGASTRVETRLGRYTPLHLAAQGGHARVVRLLIDATADVRAVTTTGASPLHFASAAGDAEAVGMLLDAGADVNAREPQWGQTPLMFAAAAGRTAAVQALLARGANPAVAATVVDISARNRADGAESRQRNARVAAIQKSLAARAASSGSAPPGGAASVPGASAGGGAGRGADSQEEPEPLGYADLVGAHGGLTPLLLAAREGFDDTAMALLDGGADVNQVSASDRTSPLLIATINGHFDLAMRLIGRGADVTAASDAGATPLYGVLNMQWAPKSRHPQPTRYMQQRVDYLELAEALLAAGADPNARLARSLWYTTYNRDLLGVDRTGATAFWRAAYALDVAAMRLLLKYGADATVPTAKVPERFEDGPESTGVDQSGVPPIPFGGPAVAPIHAASGAGYGLGFAGNSHRYVPDGWLPAVRFLVEELGADVNARDHHGYTPVHHAASRGDNDLILYLVSKGADVKAVSRSGQTTVDLANGPVQRVQPFPETVELLTKLGAKNNHRCVSC